uniref:Uncharacterized protein n=1 Tax=Cacopsylla melanoneura TaxID=428564 RepID=A0A8D8R621_9HEMI
MCVRSRTKSVQSDVRRATVPVSHVLSSRQSFAVVRICGQNVGQSCVRGYCGRRPFRFLLPESSTWCHSTSSVFLYGRASVARYGFISVSHVYQTLPWRRD